MDKHILVTGGAGFIGSMFVRLAEEQGYKVTVLDALTYAGHRTNLSGTKADFIHGNICDADLVSRTVAQLKPVGLLHFAAESHVDNSILGPKAFVQTNVFGTFTLLEAAREHLSILPPNFRFLHVSTDEVFGDLKDEGYFTEETPYHPHSPYSATKAGSDHLVRAWHRTYRLPTLITNCSNNYGPRQHPEKLIPKAILNALSGKAIPVYGQGLNVRDWIHVEDHARGVLMAFEKGRVGGTYCFGGRSERKNIEVVRRICSTLDELKPRAKGSYEELIQFVEDRKGHDFRYAIDDSKAVQELGDHKRHSTFEIGLKQTVQWYMQNTDWVKQISGRAQ